MNLLKHTLWIGYACAQLALPMAGSAQTVRLHGAVALSKMMTAQKSAIESKAGAQLEIVGNGAGRGLADLCGGQADIAMLAGSLKDVANAMNKEKAGSVDITGLNEIAITSTKVLFVTHPAAGVKSLTDQQVGDVLVGKAVNWKEVGGADMPIKVVLPFGADGSRVTYQSKMLQGADYTKNAIVRNSSKDVAAVLAQLPGTCSILAAINVEGNMVAVTTEKEVMMPFAVVLKGQPSGAVQKVIDATKLMIK